MSGLGLLLSAVTALTIAQNITTSLYIPGAVIRSPSSTVPAVTLVGSIIGSEGTVTSYVLQNEDDSPFGTLTEGPEIAVLSMTFNPDTNSVYTAALACSVDSTASAVCLEYCTGSCIESQTSTLTFSSLEESYVTVIIPLSDIAIGTGSSTTNNGGLIITTAATTTDTNTLPSNTQVTAVSTVPATTIAAKTTVVTGAPVTGTATGASCIGSHKTGFWTCSTAGGPAITVNSDWALNRGWALGAVAAFAMM